MQKYRVDESQDAESDFSPKKVQFSSNIEEIPLEELEEVMEMIREPGFSSLFTLLLRPFLIFPTTTKPQT